MQKTDHDEWYRLSPADLCRLGRDLILEENFSLAAACLQTVISRDRANVRAYTLLIYLHELSEDYNGATELNEDLRWLRMRGLPRTPADEVRCSAGDRSPLR